MLLELGRTELVTKIKPRKYGSHTLLRLIPLCKRRQKERKKKAHRSELGLVEGVEARLRGSLLPPLWHLRERLMLLWTVAKKPRDYKLVPTKSV